MHRPGVRPCRAPPANVFVGLVLLILAGAGCQRLAALRGHSAGSDASISDADADAGATLPGTMVLSGPNTIRRASFAPNGDVIATTARSLLRFAPQTDAPATVTTFPVGMFAIVSARAAEVSFGVSNEGEVYVLRRPQDEPTKILQVHHSSFLDISDDGRVIAIGEYVDADTGRSLAPTESNGYAQKTAFYDLTGKRLALVDDGSPKIDPSGRFVAGTDGLVSLTGDPPLGVAGHPFAAE